MWPSQKLRLVICSGFAAHLAQKNLSILLDTPTLGEEDHVEVSPFEVKLPLRNPNAVSLTASPASSAKKGGTYWVPYPSSARGSTSCPTYRCAHPRRQRFQATPLCSDSLRRGGISNFAKRRTIHV